MLGILNKFFPTDLKRLLDSDYAAIHNLKLVLLTSDSMPGSEGVSNAVGKDDALEANLSSLDNHAPSTRKSTLRATADIFVSGRKGHPKASGSTPENATSSKQRATDDPPLASSTVAKKRKRGCAKHENCVFAALFGRECS
uniref:Uncharacterized protein n=1 Tax=Bionectria ochroleuca TaxID=29856 RepID=A0A8H7N4X7_BIOOC